MAFPTSCNIEIAEDTHIRDVADRRRVWFAQLLGALAWLSGQYDDTEFVFRGHSEESWELASSLWRFSGATSEAELRKAERGILTDVKRDFWFTREFQFEPEGDNWRTLAVLQHHGIPTRLMDGTSDPLVGLYFAVTGIAKVDAHDKVDGALYMIRRPSAGGSFLPYDVRSAPQATPRVTAQRSLFLLPKRLPRTSSAAEFYLIKAAHRSPVAGEVSMDGVSIDCKGPSTVTGFSGLVGRFLAGTHVGRPSRYPPNIVRFIIPHLAKPICRENLRALGVSARNLYPGIDGYKRGLLIEGDRPF